MWPPVASRVSAGAAILNLLNNLVFENLVGQAENLWIQVEIAILMWDIARLSFLPICKQQWWRYDAVLWIASEISVWKAWPEVAPIWLLGVANIARLASKDSFGRQALWSSCIDSCWLWAESDLERRRLNNRCGGGRHISQL